MILIPIVYATAHGWWTSEHVLALTNVLLACAALAAIFVSWYATTRTLKKSDDQLALDTASFQATLQPIVVETTEAPGDISIMKHMDDGRYEVRGYMRNIGRGPAFVRKAEFISGKGEPETLAIPSRNVLPVDEWTSIVSNVMPGERFYDLLEREAYEFAVALNYDDISRSQRTRSVMRLKMTLPNVEILGIGIYHCDEKWVRERDPFAGYDPYAHGIDPDDATAPKPAPTQ